MKIKKIYNTPTIERTIIDVSISLMMDSFTEDDQGGVNPDNPDDWDLPPAGVSGKTFSGSKIEKTESTNTFDQNPFK